MNNFLQTCNLYEKANREKIFDDPVSLYPQTQ